MKTKDQIDLNIIDQGHLCKTTEDVKQLFNVKSFNDSYINSEHGRMLKKFFSDSESLYKREGE